MKDGLYIQPCAVKDEKIILFEKFLTNEEVCKILAKSVVDAFISILDPSKSSDTNGGE